MNPFDFAQGRHIVVAVVTCAVSATLVAAQNQKPAPPHPKAAASPSWNARAATSYLDARMDWWVHWPSAVRDHDTTCVSCHTAVPYVLARPALHKALAEQAPTPSELAMYASVVKRVTMWREVEPFYGDQKNGLPKTSESRGTEAILNAVVLAARDAHSGTLKVDSAVGRGTTAIITLPKPAKP